MKIKVDAESLVQVIEAIKKLSVSGDFDAADRWVGCVLKLQEIIVTSEPVEETEVVEHG